MSDHWKGTHCVDCNVALNYTNGMRRLIAVNVDEPVFELVCLDCLFGSNFEGER